MHQINWTNSVYDLIQVGTSHQTDKVIKQDAHVGSEKPELLFRFNTPLFPFPAGPGNKVIHLTVYVDVRARKNKTLVCS